MNESDIPNIKRVEIDRNSIGQFKSEEDYLDLSVQVLIEVGTYVCLAGNLFPSERGSWNRDEAIIGGHLIRIYKLIHALLDQTCQKRREISSIIDRLAFECVVNLRYLIANASEDLFQEYRMYSLKHEYRLLKLIEKNIGARGGNIIPIEDRMIKSIERSFTVSGISIDNFKFLKHWGGKNTFEKAESLGLDTVYLAHFGGGSHSIHGNWQDLLEYNLEESENSFKPIIDWRRPRPQSLNAIALLSTEALIDHIRWLVGEKAQKMILVYEDLKERIIDLDQLHEEFLNQDE